MKKELFEREDLIAVAENLAVGIVKIVLDNSCTVLYGNDVFYELIGYNEQEFENMSNSLRQIVFEEEQELFLQKVEMVRNNLVENIEFAIFTQSEEIKYLKIYLKRLESTTEDTINCYSGVLFDITDFKVIQKELEVEEERYRIISEISNDINFEYDIILDTMVFGPQFEKIYKSDGVIQNFKEVFLKEKNVAAKDVTAFEEIFFHKNVGDKRQYTELRLNLAQDGYEWFRIYHTTILDEDGCEVKIVGRIVNIDYEKREKEHLLKKSQLDTMTKLLNKKAIENKINQYLIQVDESKQNAMLIIDVDNFKKINDNYGHLFGDAVLIEIAKTLKKNFADGELVGRIGGDEFLVYITSNGTEDEVKEKAQRLCQQIERIHTSREWKGRVSISVGAFVQDGKEYSYEEMFVNADNALYIAKKMGKNQYAIYNDKVES
ncbi:diguanylate cyclase (GGDEF) domain-containing protein [Anaeromicropila populeti]|uniref:Diguanylate cyclase (GGDEF) domain-containing protein n=2 Tax=Anaeromicropila populeti TaxID=37658 RepID=A0A1I6IAS0_9FIRM|nr:diguanylate cyclase (GGDEF) domain-containing protein [Anaeromicropila populeti]